MSDLELAPDTAAVTVEAPVGAGDPLAVYLARLTSPESRRAMAGSLEFLAERLVDRGPATAEERRRRRQEQRLLASHIPWHASATPTLRRSGPGWPSTARQRPPTGTWPPSGVCSGRPGASA
jgi:hypothetical protein